MNEFTKHELELIAECVEADFYHSNWSKSMYEPLINKIQSIIDNYCEHRLTTGCGTCSGFMDVICVKCDKEFPNE